jgi:hypothetical protein
MADPQQSRWKEMRASLDMSAKYVRESTCPVRDLHKNFRRISVVLPAATERPVSGS